MLPYGLGTVTENETEIEMLEFGQFVLLPEPGVPGYCDDDSVMVNGTIVCAVAVEAMNPVKNKQTHSSVTFRHMKDLESTRRRTDAHRTRGPGASSMPVEKAGNLTPRATLVPRKTAVAV
jgi:hypothetical protein